MWSILHSLWDFLEGKMLKVHSLQSMFHLELYNMHERKDALHECLGFSSSVTLCTTENCYILFMFSAFSVLEEVRSKKQSKLIALSFLFFFFAITCHANDEAIVRHLIMTESFSHILVGS